MMRLLYLSMNCAEKAGESGDIQMTNTNEIKEFLEIIKDSSFDSKPRGKTFMDVTRYPHYENFILIC